MSAPALKPFERGKAFDSLARSLADGHAPLAMIGSGASMPSKYPSWQGLIDELAEGAGDKARIPQRAKALSEDLLWAAESHRLDMGPKAFSAYVKKRFGPPAKVAEPYPTLAGMKFRHFLTTNYDPCMELALRTKGRAVQSIEWDESEQLSDFLINLARPSATRAVVYLHGRYDRPDRLVLTESSYVSRYIASDDARRKLLAIFMTHPVVFVGFSMNDPDFAMVMREVTARLRSKTPCHYAILGYGSEPERDVYRQRMRGKFGVEPIFYSYAEGADKHANLLQLLDALQGKPPRPPSKTPPKPPPAPPAGAAAPGGPGSPGPPPASPVNPLDPHKWQFGGKAVDRGRQLKVIKTGGSLADGELIFDLVVERLPAAEPLLGDVTFHLHPTFRPDVYRVAADGQRAALEECSAYGAFTVGVTCDNGATRLELDLSLEALPLWFRKR